MLKEKSHKNIKVLGIGVALVKLGKKPKKKVQGL